MTNELCPCQKDYALCTTCVTQGLSQVQEARMRALQAHAHAARTYQPATVVNELEDLNDEARQWREKLQRLHEQQSEMAMRVAKNNVALAERREQLRRWMGLQPTERWTPSDESESSGHQQETTEMSTVTAIGRSRLQRLQGSVLTSLELSIQANRRRAHLLRWSWALQALTLHRLDVPLPASEETPTHGTSDKSLSNRSKRRTARGIGSIGGLVLPNAGHELFGVLPEAELASALRMVASATKLVAQCLGIELPHPILLQPPLQGRAQRSNDDSDIINMVVKEDSPDPLRCTTANRTQRTNDETPFQPASASFIGTFLDQSKSMLIRAISTTPAAPEHATGKGPTKQAQELSMDPHVVQQRVRHAQAAMLQDDRIVSGAGPGPTHPSAPVAAANAAPVAKQGSLFSLTLHSGPSGSPSVVSPRQQVEEFGIGWQLLQHNVVFLCIRAGVPVDDLWPADAVLLNLRALEEFGKRVLLHGNDGNE